MVSFNCNRIGDINYNSIATNYFSWMDFKKDLRSHNEEYHTWVNKNFMAGFNDPVQILKNPTRREAMREIDSYKDNRDMRGCVDPMTGNIYCWDVDAIHEEIVPEIKEVDPDSVIRFDMEENSINTKLASPKDTEWYKDLFQQNEKFMTFEPEFHFTFLAEKASGVGSMDGDPARQNSDDYFAFPSSTHDVIQYDDTEDHQTAFSNLGSGQQKKKLKKKIYMKEAQRVTGEYVLQCVQAIHYKPSDFGEGDLADRIMYYGTYELKMIPIDSVKYNFDMDEDMVDEYAKKIGNKGDYPPIVVEPEWNGTYEIVDGTHRTEALKQLGRQVVKAYVPVVGDEND